MEYIRIFWTEDTDRNGHTWSHSKLFVVELTCNYKYNNNNNTNWGHEQGDRSIWVGGSGSGLEDGVTYSLVCHAQGSCLLILVVSSCLINYLPISLSLSLSHLHIVQCVCPSLTFLRARLVSSCQFVSHPVTCFRRTIQVPVCPECVCVLLV